MTSSEFVTIARVRKPQGRRGEVACEILTDFPEKFADRKRLFLKSATASGAPARELLVEDHWFHKGQVVFKFEGVDSISDAEALAGCELQIPAAERAALEEGAYFIHDLIGSTVFDDGREVGTIRDIDPRAGAAPLLLVVGSDETEIEVPFAEPYLVEVDVAAKRVHMRLPEGLVDLNR